MIDQTNLLKYAHKLVRNSPLCSEEGHVGVRIMTLVEHSHNPEMVLAALQKERKHCLWDGEDTTALDAAIKKILEG